MSIKNWTIKTLLSQKCRFGLLGISLLIALIDQATKFYVRNHLVVFQVKPFIKFWNWTLAYNQGAAFSLMATQGCGPQLFFGFIALVVSVGLVYFLLNYAYSPLAGTALSFVLGGAVGNLIDRILHGRVTDFIDWYYNTHHWPAFNVADSFITIGVTLLIIENIFFAPPKDES